MLEEFRLSVLTSAQRSEGITFFGEMGESEAQRGRKISQKSHSCQVAESPLDATSV